MNTTKSFEGSILYGYKDIVLYLIKSINELKFENHSFDVRICRPLLDDLIPKLIDANRSVLFYIPNEKYEVGMIEERIIYKEGSFTSSEFISSNVNFVKFNLSNHSYTIYKIDGSKLEFIKNQFEHCLFLQKTFPNFPMYKKELNIVDFCLSLKTDFEVNNYD